MEKPQVPQEILNLAEQLRAAGTTNVEILDEAANTLVASAIETFPISKQTKLGKVFVESLKRTARNELRAQFNLPPGV